MSVDLNKRIKTCLENGSLSTYDDFCIDEGNNGKTNCLCSNQSTIFVFSEQNATLFSINLNKLAFTSNYQLDSKKIKETHVSYSLNECIQRLIINALPVGDLNKIQINNSGTHILLVYNKSLSAVQLPLKWGKFEEFEGGSAKIICKSIEFQLKNITHVIDAMWHTPPDDEYIMCLTRIGNDTVVKCFSLTNHNVILKTFNLSSSITSNPFLSTQLEKTDFKLANKKQEGDRFMSIEIGTRFAYNDKYAYPVFLLKSNGEIHCLIEYENSKNFDYLGALTIDPYCMDYDADQVLDFICLPSQPNCIALLLNTGIIHHCVFIPYTRSMPSETLVAQTKCNATFESTNFYEDGNFGTSGDAILYVYESIQLNANEVYTNLSLQKDSNDPFRYYICHKAGVHCVYLPWLESSRNALQNSDNFDTTDYGETRLAEISYLICTQPMEDNKNTSTISGLTCVLCNDSRTILVALKKNAQFICSNIYKTAQYDIESRHKNEHGHSESYSVDNGRFVEYIKGILKRDFTLPIIKSDINNANKDNEDFILKVINSLKSEYLEKQKQAFNELIKRSKRLKQQAQLEKEKTVEISNNLDKFNSIRLVLEKRFDLLSTRQAALSERLKNYELNLTQSMSIMSEAEVKLFRELKTVKETLKSFEKQIKDFKSLGDFGVKSSVAKEIKDFKYDDDELKTMKDLMKNEANKIKEIKQRIEKLRVAVDI